jgi:hypothetical protein
MSDDKRIQDMAWAKSKIDAIVDGTFAYPVPKADDPDGIFDMTDEQYMTYLLKQWEANDGSPGH